MQINSSVLAKSPAGPLLRYRFLVLTALVLCLLLALLGLRNFHPSIDPKQHTFMSKKDKLLAKNYAKKFDSGYTLLFYLEPTVDSGLGIFDSDSLSYQRDLLDAAMHSIPNAVSSYSIFSVLPSRTKFPLDDATRQWLEERTQASKLLGSSLIEPQQKSILFLVNLQAEVSSSLAKRVEQQYFFLVGEQVQQLRLRFADPRFKLLVSGVPVMIHQQVVELRHDLLRILIALILVSLLMMALVIRSLVGVIGAISIAGASILLLFGLMGFLNVQIDLTFILIPTLLAIAISIGYTVHFINHYRRSMGRVNEQRLALIIAWRRCFKPLLFTSLTTILSLLSLLQTQIPVMQVAGSAAAAAIGLVFLLTISILPCILSFQPQHLWGKEIQRRKKVLEDSQFISHGLNRFSQLLIAARKPVNIIALVISLVMFYFLLKVDITLDYTQQMGSKLVFSQERLYLQQTGFVPFDRISMLLELPAGEALEPEVLTQLSLLQQNMLKKFPLLVDNSSSLADLVLDFQQFRYGRQSFPPNAAMVNGLIQQVRSASDINPYDWVSKDNSTLQVFINIQHYDAAEILKLGDWLKDETSQLFPQAKQMFLQGFLYEESSKNQMLTLRMLISYGLSLLMITIIFWIMFKKLSVTLVAMAPNLLPVIIGGGMIGLLKIKLDYILMMVAPMVIGLAVDDTIHFCHYALSRYHHTGNLVKSLEITMRHIGVSLIETSLILGLSFLTFLLARTSIIANMGWLAILGIGIALLADLTLTPILLYQLLSRQRRRQGLQNT